MSKREQQREVRRMIRGFGQEVVKTMDKARRSGALPDGINDIVLARMVFPIVAENFRVLNDEHKKVAKNLRLFV